ncbi:MAG: Jag N-terminal domain-containing protein [Anaerolineales bacterium]|nr:Jag N-terminal domain-containing protein [Anaerolineales bacterium]
MNEKPTLEIIAPTVEEALAQGLAQLGLPAEAVSMEVLDAGTKGLFGLGGRQVRVRLTVKSDEEVTSSEPTPSASKPDREPFDQTKGRPAPVSPLPLGRASKGKPEPKPKEPAPSPVLEEGAGTDELLNLAEETVSKLLYHMNLQAQVSAHYEETDREDRRAIHVDVRGDDLSILIGRRSETLNAFQYVASLMVGKQVQQWVQLVVDVEGYRNRRERQLRQMARRMAEQVVKTGRRQVLEPMSANERRIIHLELREHPAVTTESVGEEPHRKVTIIPKDS